MLNFKTPACSKGSDRNNLLFGIQYTKMDIMSEASTNTNEYVSPLARLFHLARKQGYLTYDDILAEMPQADLSLEQVDRLFGALIAAGIPYGDESAFFDNGDRL